MESGIELIAAERKRQVEIEGWTAEHDDEHGNSDLAWAAVSYASRAARTDEARANYAEPETTWPWSRKHWKPGNRVRELVKAGALIAAEIDRIQRSAA